MNRFMLPIIAVQGLWVRCTTDLLPAAGGPSAGAVTGHSDEVIRLAVLGESTAAGCGAGLHEDGFAGALARDLSERSGQSVEWRTVGQPGATATRIRYQLLPRIEKNLDVTVLLAGVNDVLARRTPERWGDDLGAILDHLADRTQLTVVAGIAPFDAFPSLPTALGRYLQEQAAALDRISQQVCADRPRTSWLSSTRILPIRPSFFATDGFHPSEAGYRRWAQAVGAHLAPYSAH